MTTLTTRYRSVQGAFHHVRPLTLMQQYVLHLCTYGMAFPVICRESFYPPLQVAQTLDFLMRHGLVKRESGAAKDSASWQRA
jgi:hypothetical protein